MHINRELDKTFRVTVSEREAVLICDCSIMDFERTRHVATTLGTTLLSYMVESCQNPHAVMPTREVEL